MGFLNNLNLVDKEATALEVYMVWTAAAWRGKKLQRPQLPPCWQKPTTNLLSYGPRNPRAQKEKQRRAAQR
eukprot:NODE_4456_length_347_cov_185.724832_g3853_i0.p1 GENE.NODE_4456_length_347_cov_185.724832_g3853_i0~~NODE_4456_length_347_cov_185.724832_g3853_i0.p1  ORF type:complete len:71 (-),score=4.37 NODE_4456_length_347_cov_185.724832_g3853_i0:107-319(-)